MGDAPNSESTPKAAYILVDYENVRRKFEADHLRLVGSSTRVTLFCGPSQKDVPIDLAVAMQGLGSRASYELVIAPGRNSLDFAIAHYLGNLSTKEPTAAFYIIAEDKDYDPHVLNLRAKGLSVHRLNSLKEMPSPGKKAATGKVDTKAVIADLEKRAKTRPRTLKKLETAMRSRFGFSEAESQMLIVEIRSQGVFEEREGKLVYPRWDARLGVESRRHISEF